MKKVLFAVGKYFKKADMILIAITLIASLFPVIGISLPFFSSGGSSVTSCFFAIGIAISVYMHRSEALF